MKKPVTKKTATKKVAGKVVKEPMTLAERVSASREKVLDSGGRRISTLMLKPDAATALATLEADGRSATQIISELLIAAAKRKR